MTKAGIKQVRQNLTKYLKQVERGGEVVITRRREPVARLVPVPRKSPVKLASHESLRALLRPRGAPLSRTVVDLREERV